FISIHFVSDWIVRASVLVAVLGVHYIWEGSGLARMPSVASKSTVASARSGAVAARPRTPARVDAPDGPASRPRSLKSCTARAASLSDTAIDVSMPSRKTGQAMLETVPQHSPAIMLGWVGTVTGSPRCRDSSTAGACSGSTPRTLVAEPAER